MVWLHCQVPHSKTDALGFALLVVVKTVLDLRPPHVQALSHRQLQQGRKLPRIEALPLRVVILSTLYSITYLLEVFIPFRSISSS
jgi:hypothetical protein